MKRPTFDPYGMFRVMDPYCCSGGSARGWMKAGFYVVGVDIEPQPNYIGHEFHQGDAIELIKAHGHEFDAILASPPCQFYSNLNAYNHKDYPDLIAPTREAIQAVGVPYVIENVEVAAPALVDPVMLCGSMFGLKVYRHRLFEAGGGFTIQPPTHPKHEALCTRNGYLPTPERPFMSIHGGKHSRAWLEAAKEAMGMPWVGRNSDVKTGIREVCEAIPPAYTEFIGRQLMAHLRGETAATADEQQHAAAMAAVAAEPMQPQTVTYTAVMPTVTGVSFGFGPGSVAAPESGPWTASVTPSARHAAPVGMPAGLAEFDWKPAGVLR